MSLQTKQRKKLIFFLGILTIFCHISELDTAKTLHPLIPERDYGYTGFQATEYDRTLIMLCSILGILSTIVLLYLAQQVFQQ